MRRLSAPSHRLPLQFIAAPGLLVAKRSRRTGALPTVHCIDNALRPTPKESTMNRTIATQAASLSLALLVTLCTLMGLNSLASAEHATSQQVAAATAVRA